MTPEQMIKREILLQGIDAGEFQHGGEIDGSNVDRLYDAFSDIDLCQDLRNEFRCSGDPTGLDCAFSRNYDSDAVGREMTGGVWVGWTYWHGGGRHSDPDSIPWMEHAYFLDVTEEQKMVTVRAFKKQETAPAK